MGAVALDGHDAFGGLLAGADLGGVLASLGMLSGKLAAARAAVLSRFDAPAPRRRRLRVVGLVAGGEGPHHPAGRRGGGPPDAAVPRPPRHRRGSGARRAVRRVGGQDRRLDPQAPARLARRDRQAAGGHRGRGGAGGPGDRRPGRVREMAAAQAPTPSSTTVKTTGTSSSPPPLKAVGRVNGNLTGLAPPPSRPSWKH